MVCHLQWDNNFLVSLLRVSCHMTCLPSMFSFKLSLHICQCYKPQKGWPDQVLLVAIGYQVSYCCYVKTSELMTLTVLIFGQLPFKFWAASFSACNELFQRLLSEQHLRTFFFTRMKWMIRRISGMFCQLWNEKSGANDWGFIFGPSLCGQGSMHFFQQNKPDWSIIKIVHHA